MKKILLLLLLATFGMQAQTLQNPTFGNLKLKNNLTSTTATKVNVQENDGTINTISKSDLVNYLEFASAVNLPVTGEQGKLYLTKDNNRLYRFNGTIYQELTTDISGKEDIANKQNSLAVDGTNTKYPTVTAVNTGLALKANLNGVVTLTGNQTITGQKTFNNSTLLSAVVTNNTSTGTGLYAGNSSAGTGIYSNNQSTGKGIHSDNSSGGVGIYSINHQSGDGIVSNQGPSGTGFNYVGQNNGTNTFTVDKLGAVAAASFIKSSVPTTNILLAGGSDVAQNTAFNKPFGTAAGTVAEGNDSRILNGQTAFSWGNHVNMGYAFTTGSNINQASFRTALGLGTNAYSSTAYLPLSGGDINGLLEITRDGRQLSLTGSDQGAIDLYKSGTLGHRLFSDANSFGIYDLAANVERFSISKTTGAATFSSTVTASPATLPNHVVVKSQLDAVVARPYKVYTALLNQTGTSAPVATVLENTLGGSISFSRVSAGIYRISLTGAFTGYKTGFSYTRGITNNALNVTNGIRRVDNDTIEFNSVVNGSVSDGQTINDTIEIRVYN